jgi:hypothetical protein
MATVCPRCATTHEHPHLCPGCAEPLDLSDPNQPVPESSPVRWQDSPWGRILIGLLIAQGLFYGLRHLFAGISLAVWSSADAPDESAAIWGFVLSQTLQAATLLIGGVLAGSGQRGGAMLGAVIGVWNGVLTAITQSSVGQPFSAVALYGDPLLQTALGALAGWLGSAIWKPLPEEEPRGPRPTTRKAPKRQRTPLFAGRVAPVRVTLGTALAVAGSLCASALFNLIESIAETHQAGADRTLDRVVTWEIKALAVIAGGALAGCNSPNGMKQGLIVGIATGLILSAVDSSAGESWLEIAGVLLVSSTFLAMAGGWFGSQLVPPIVPYKRRLMMPVSHSRSGLAFFLINC